MRITTILLTLLICSSAHARLFETLAECEKRYGKHVDEEKDGIVLIRLYRMEGINILVHFVRGKGKKKAVARSITYTDPNEMGGFEVRMVKTFMKANGGGQKWREVDLFKKALQTEGLESKKYAEMAATYDMWVRADGKVIMSNKNFKCYCMVCTKTFIEYQGKLAKKKSRF